MGTRSTIHIVDHEHAEPVTLARMYIQYDGYPSGVGKQIKDILGGRSVVNGFSGSAPQVNGAGCMAALLISGMKEGVGGVYLTDPARDDVEQFGYTVTCHGAGKPIDLEVIGHGDKIYSGPLDSFDPDAGEADGTRN